MKKRSFPTRKAVTRTLRTDDLAGAQGGYPMDRDTLHDMNRGSRPEARGLLLRRLRFRFQIL